MCKCHCKYQKEEDSRFYTLLTGHLFPAQRKIKEWIIKKLCCKQLQRNRLHCLEARICSRETTPLKIKVCYTIISFLNITATPKQYFGTRSELQPLSHIWPWHLCTYCLAAFQLCQQSWVIALVCMAGEAWNKYLGLYRIGLPTPAPESESVLLEF